MSIDPDVFIDAETAAKFAADLEAFMAGELDEPTRWRVNSPERADYALRRITEMKAELQRYNDFADKEHEKIDNWLRTVEKKPTRTIEFFEALLRRWHEDELEADPSRTSIPLPHGVLKSRAGSVSVDVIDEEAFVEWAREHAPPWLRVQVAAEKSLIRQATVALPDGRAATENGEVVPGVRLVEAPRSFTVKTEASE